jgi:hypothetical protein
MLDKSVYIRILDPQFPALTSEGVVSCEGGDTSSGPRPAYASSAPPAGSPTLPNAASHPDSESHQNCAHGSGGPMAAICSVCGCRYLLQDRRSTARHNRRACSRRCASKLPKLTKPFHAPDGTNAEKVRANGLINMRIRRGQMVRPGACQHCGAKGKTDAHHPDYQRPAEVVFLCRSCHMKCHFDPDFERRVSAARAHQNRSHP